MTIDEVKARVEEIEAWKGDDEAAHGKENQLREDFIRYVAETATPSLAEKARLVLSTNHIEFARWCG
jgi:hypothetical protein